MQFQDKKNPQKLKTFLLEKVKYVMFIFLYDIIGLHFLEAIKQ